MDVDQLWVCDQKNFLECLFVLFFHWQVTKDENRWFESAWSLQCGTCRLHYNRRAFLHSVVEPLVAFSRSQGMLTEVPQFLAHMIMIRCQLLAKEVEWISTVLRYDLYALFIFSFLRSDLPYKPLIICHSARRREHRRIGPITAHLRHETERLWRQLDAAASKPIYSHLLVKFWWHLELEISDGVLIFVSDHSWCCSNGGMVIYLLLALHVHHHIWTVDEIDWLDTVVFVSSIVSVWHGPPFALFSLLVVLLELSVDLGHVGWISFHAMRQLVPFGHVAEKLSIEDRIPKVVPDWSLFILLWFPTGEESLVSADESSKALLLIQVVVPVVDLKFSGLSLLHFFIYSLLADFLLRLIRH